jgi:hypothetical protein
MAASKRSNQKYRTFIDPRRDDRLIAIAEAPSDLEAELLLEKRAVRDPWWIVREATEPERAVFLLGRIDCEKIYWPPCG